MNTRNQEQTMGQQGYAFSIFKVSQGYSAFTLMEIQLSTFAWDEEGSL